MAYLTPKEMAGKLFERQLTAEGASLQPRNRARINSLIIVDEIITELNEYRRNRPEYWENVKTELEKIYGNPLDYVNIKEKSA